MKKTFILSAMLMLSIAVMAQESTITVSGQAETQVQPELVVFSYQVTSTEKDYNGAVDKLNYRTDRLTKKLKSSGFKTEDIKTSNFNIRKNKIYNQGKAAGTEYIASQSIAVRFDYDIKKLLTVLNNTADAEISANLSINFLLTDEQKKGLQDELLKQAMLDAKSKATLLASMEGYHITGVKSITHNSNQGAVPRNARVEYDGMSMMSENNASSFEPSDVTVREQVHVVYNIWE
ncbi:MAG: SIMPL domain-containing protein [Reichenbachiella sp.]